MRTQFKRHSLTGHNPHDLVSTMIRFANEADYVEAVRVEYHRRKGKDPKNPPKHDAYSFKNQDDTELVMLYQPDIRFPTGSTPVGLPIHFEYVGEMTLSDFSDYYDRQIAAHPDLGRKEVPGSSYRGDQDKAKTYRAVFERSAKKTVSYEGIITNPPYPAIFGSVNSGFLKWMLPAVLGLATGLAAVPLLRVLRSHVNE